jgi:glucosamine--fructose-6-phosphate aminotransferase (isomerizing)
MSSRMLEEAQAAAASVARQLALDRERYADLGALLRATPPQRVATVARGSSDHAAAWFAYLAMARLGQIVASLPMSLLTLHGAPLQAQGTLAVAISQSGQSPDVVEPIRYFRAHGGTTVALINAADSPLGAAAEWPMPLHAGPELSVAATKSFIASLTAGARLVSAWQDDALLEQALQRLPEQLDKAARCDWSAALDVLVPARNIMVVGRGLGFPIALEAALKLKETSALQAEAFSGAEIRHGPMALVEEGYPLLVFAPRGPGQAGLLELADDMRQRGAQVLLCAPQGVPGRALPLPQADHPDLDPVLAIQAFYVMAARLAEARGLDPDRPRHLSKVTRTS